MKQFFKIKLSKDKKRLFLSKLSLLLVISFLFKGHVISATILNLISVFVIIYLILKQGQELLVWKRIKILITIFFFLVINYALIYSFLSANDYFNIDGYRKGETLGLFDGFYISLTTIIAAGSGNIYPTTKLSKFIIASEMISGVVILVLGLGYILSTIPQLSRKNEKD